MTHRREQLASLIHRAVQDILSRGLNDPRIRGMITVTEVDVSGDLRDAIVHVSILPAEQQNTTMHGLTAATMRIQRMMNERLDVRRPPHIRLSLDERVKKQAQLLAAIREAVDGGGESTDDEEVDPDETGPEASGPARAKDAGGDPHS